MASKADKAVMVTMGDLARLATKEDVARVEGAMEHLATKAELAQLSARVEQLASQTATKAELAQLSARVDQLASQMATKADLANLEAKMLRWFVGTAITLAGLVYTLTRFAG